MSEQGSQGVIGVLDVLDVLTAFPLRRDAQLAQLRTRLHHRHDAAHKAELLPPT